MSIVHTISTDLDSAPAANSPRAWILASTVIGSVIEWYDFYIYGTAAALVFGKLFFPASDPAVGTLAAFLTFAVGLFARPVGSIVFGHYGDRLGRKSMLMLSLFLMGVPTVAIGCLPTYASIGVWAPVLLVLLRLVQGFALGGEWGGAVLMSVEHAPDGRRSTFGSLPQVGVPGGVLLSIGAFAILGRMSDAEFLAWGWRIPFIASSLLVAFGLAVRWRLQESPEFNKARKAGLTSGVPIVGLAKRRLPQVLLAAGAKFGEVTLFFLVTVYLVSYLTAKLGMVRADVLNLVLVGAAIAFVGIPIGGMLGDRFGARLIYGIGTLLLAIASVPMFMLIETHSPANVALALIVPLGFAFPLMFGPQPSLYAAQFPAELRYSGMSLGVSLASAIGGGLAPVVATGLVSAYGNSLPIGYYLCAMALLSAFSVYMMRPAPRSGTEAAEPNH